METLSTRRQRFYGVTLVAVMLLPFQVAEAEPTYSAKYQSCLDASDGVTAKMMDCIGQEGEKQDKRLNVAYKSVLAAVSGERQSQLREAQRAWVKFRDVNCKFYADPEGGTIASISAADCVLKATAERAEELEQISAEQ